MTRTFEEWWSSVPASLKQKARKGDEANKSDYLCIASSSLSGKHDLKPSHEELKEWLHSGQVDVLRMQKK
jgi:hypothetical protein